MYPREAHVAEKLHAYTLPRPRENSRIKDVPDIALLATTDAYEASVLRRAIEATFAFRQTHPMPPSLPAPPGTWARAYAEIARVDGLPWRDLDTIAAAARAFLDPVLGGAVGIWDAKAWAWKSPEQKVP